MENAVVHSAHCLGERTAPALESGSRGAERSVSLLLFPPCRISPGWPTPNLVQVHRQYQDEGHSQESTTHHAQPKPCSAATLHKQLLCQQPSLAACLFWSVVLLANSSNKKQCRVCLAAPKCLFFISFLPDSCPEQLNTCLLHVWTVCMGTQGAVSHHTRQSFQLFTKHLISKQEKMEKE